MSTLPKNSDIPKKVVVIKDHNEGKGPGNTDLKTDGKLLAEPIAGPMRLRKRTRQVFEDSNYMTDNLNQEDLMFQLGQFRDNIKRKKLNADIKVPPRTKVFVRREDDPP